MYDYYLRRFLSVARLINLLSDAVAIDRRLRGRSTQENLKWSKARRDEESDEVAVDRRQFADNQGRVI